MVVADVPTSEYLHLALTIVGAIGSLVFGFIGWLVRAEVKRAVADYTRLTTDVKQLARDHAEFREWTRLILGLAGIISSDGQSTGRRLSDKR